MTQQQPLERVSLIDTLVARLEQQILSKQYAVGTRLPAEEELARELGVSRPIVREGLSRLRERGYVETISGRGTFVKVPDADQLSVSLVRQMQVGHNQGFDVDNLYEARATIEVSTARLAAERADSDDCTRLHALLDDMKRFANDPPGYTAADVGFHVEVANAARNPFLSLILRPLAKIIVEGVFTSSQSSPTGVADGIRMHTEILSAIERGDPERAAAAMYQHMQDSRRAFPDAILSERVWNEA